MYKSRKFCMNRADQWKTMTWYDVVSRNYPKSAELFYSLARGLVLSLAAVSLAALGVAMQVVLR